MKESHSALIIALLCFILHHISDSPISLVYLVAGIISILTNIGKTFRWR